MLWDSRVWKGQIIQIGEHTLPYKMEAQLKSFDCHITGVYAPNSELEKENGLGGIRSS